MPHSVDQHSAAKVPFCVCTPDVIRLIHYGYIASSPDIPRTAFSIRLLQFHDFLWQSAVVSASSFVQALSRFLETRSSTPLYARGSKYRKRNLRVPFSHSVDLFARIQVLQKKIIDDGLEHASTDQWANKCPRCFGPREHEVKADAQEPDFIIALDGNFQQRHYAYASKDNPPESKYPSSFIPPSKIINIANTFAATDTSAVGIDVRCSFCHSPNVTYIKLIA
jgi:hypothetical protein